MGDPSSYRQPLLAFSLGDPKNIRPERVATSWFLTPAFYMPDGERYGG